MRSGLGFVASYVREAGIRPDVGRGIFRRGTLRRMGSVLPGLPRRLYGNDLIGMSIGVAVGCGLRSPVLSRTMVEFMVPLGATVHLCGSVLTETFFCMTISLILYGTPPPAQKPS